MAMNQPGFLVDTTSYLMFFLLGKYMATVK